MTKNTFFDLLVLIATKYEAWETPQKKLRGGEVVEQEIQIKIYANTPLLHKVSEPVLVRRGHGTTFLQLAHIYKKLRCIQLIADLVSRRDKNY